MGELSVCVCVCVHIYTLLKCINVCYILCVISFSTQFLAGICRYIMKHEGPDV